MKQSSDDIRRKVIGLGDSSVRKSYYPLLQEKIRDLEEKQKLLMETVRSLEEREVELESLLKEKTLLLAEVNHRVKNNLQIITSMLSLSEAESQHNAEEKFTIFKRRVETLSLVYQEFIFSDNYTEVTFCEYLKTIAGEIRSDYECFDCEIEFDFPSEEVILNIDIALPLALISFELLSASVRTVCGEPGRRIKVYLYPVVISGGNKRFQLMISGNSIYLDDKSGETLIEALVHQVAGEFRIERTGVEDSFIVEF